MPVQINELIIRANVIEDNGNKATGKTSQTDNNLSNKDDIVKECVALVMEILKKKNER